MRENVPESVSSTAQDLQQDSIVELYRLVLADGTIIRFTSQTERVWRGDTYAAIPCTLSQLEQDPQGRATRPKFSFANPGGVFTGPIQRGMLNNAALTRFRILGSDLAANINAAITEKFFISKIVQLNINLCVVECRDVFDGPLFKLPARSYYPPEFPHVSIR